MMLPSTTSSGEISTALAMVSLGSRSEARAEAPSAGDAAGTAAPRAVPKNNATTDTIANRESVLSLMLLPPFTDAYQSGRRYLIIPVRARAQAQTHERTAGSVQRAGTTSGKRAGGGRQQGRKGSNARPFLPFCLA